MIVPTKLGLDYKKVEPLCLPTAIRTWLETIMTPLEPRASWEAMLLGLQNTMTRLDPNRRYWFIPNFVIQGRDVDIRARLSVFELVVDDPMTQGIYVPDGSTAHTFCILMEIPMQKGWLENVGRRTYVRTGLIGGHRIIFDYEHAKDDQP